MSPFTHISDVLCVVMKFVLPTMEDLKFLLIEFDSNCGYLDVDINRSKFPTHYLPNIRNFCNKIVPYISSYLHKRRQKSITKSICGHGK